MEISDSDDQGGNTPPITAEYIGKSLSQIANTLNELTKWKDQMTSQVIKIFLFHRNIHLYCSFNSVFLKPFF